MPELVLRPVARSGAFYRDLIGFTANDTHDDPPFAHLSLSAAQLTLEQANPSTWTVGTLEPPFGRGINLQIAYDDTGGTERRLISAGVPLYRPVADS